MAISHKDKGIAQSWLRREKSAPSHIIRTDMLSEELKGKKQAFLQEVQDEFVRLVREQRLLFPLAKARVAETLLLLRSGDYQGAWWSLQSAYGYFGSFVRHLRFYSPDLFSMEQNFQYGLSILDLGIFAYRLEGSFLQLYDVVLYLWEKRRAFYPHLASALRATYWFRCLIEAGHKLEEALSRAIEIRHELYEMFGYGSENPFMRAISIVLTPDALAELKQILLTIASERLGCTR
jgi:hypothetical protein